MSLRARIFIIVSLVVFIILGISLFLLWRSKQPAKNTPNGQTTTVDNLNGAESPLRVADLNNVKVGKTSSIETQQKAVQNLAKIFVERYNTFSTDANYQNVKDLQTLVTPKYWQLLSAKIPKQPLNNTTSISSFTQALGATIASWGEKEASVDLQVKITEEKNGVSSKRDQQATVTLVKSDNNWLVDSFSWKK